MNVQHERIVELCTELRLGALAAPYPALAQQGAKQQLSFTDFLETLLSAERESQRVRTREMFAWVAGFPAIKTLGRRRRFQFVSFAGGRVKWPRPGLGTSARAFLERHACKFCRPATRTSARSPRPFFCLLKHRRADPNQPHLAVAELSLLIAVRIYYCRLARALSIVRSGRCSSAGIQG